MVPVNSRGSVIANFDVKTTAADPTAINKANAGLATSLPAVYQVDISSFNIIYSSKSLKTFSNHIIANSYDQIKDALNIGLKNC